MTRLPPPSKGRAYPSPPPPVGGGRGEGSSALDAALRLAAVLDRENAALTVLDLARAAAMLTEKQEAATAFTLACQPDSLAGANASELARLARRLDEAASRNRQLLERGIAVQGRVLAAIARAVPAALAAQAPGRCSPRYGASGTAPPARMPLALSTRA